ncbi:universal stress protein [Mariniluteicoccus endophyticus]
MTIVVGYSTKPEGDAALRAAIAEAEVRGLPLVVVPNSADDCAGAQAVLAPLNHLEHRLAEPSEVGLVGDHILEVADQAGAELIIIGLRRRSSTGKLLLGLNAQKVLLDAGIPVMAVKAP